MQGQEAGPVGQGGAVSVEEEAGGAAGSKGLHHSGPQAEGPQADRDGASLLAGGVVPGPLGAVGHPGCTQTADSAPSRPAQAAAGHWPPLGVEVPVPGRQARPWI